MMLRELREQVLEANLELVRRGLVLFTFGNASGVDREQGLVAIKPSGVDYSELRPEHLVVTDLWGKIVDGDLRPSSDLDTHTLLYREFPSIGGVVHTHSEFATAFAQAGLPIPPLGTTHADYFHGAVPCTDPLPDSALGDRYVHETGVAIVRRFRDGRESAVAHETTGMDALSTIATGGNSAREHHGRPLDPLAVPGCLVAGHAPFAWGKDPQAAAHSAVALEYIARLAYRTLTLRANAEEVSEALLDRHYFRKHGKDATYGQQS